MKHDNYPQCLIDALVKYDVEPTGNIEWDKAILRTLQRHESDDAIYEAMRLQNVICKADKDRQKELAAYPNLKDPGVFKMHADFFTKVCNEHVLAPQHREFIFDDNNKQVIIFLLYYFNNCELAEKVFPGRGYKLHKNIMLQGEKGVGKTIMMQCFSDYLFRIKSPRAFYNLSVSQMINHYQLRSNIDAYTFNEESSHAFLPKPVNLCLNDLGLDEQEVHYGTKTELLSDKFLAARNDVWQHYNKYAHITTNLNDAALETRFCKHDPYKRIIDRFKTYNVIPVGGTSRR